MKHLSKAFLLLSMVFMLVLPSCEYGEKWWLSSQTSSSQITSSQTSSFSSSSASESSQTESAEKTSASSSETSARQSDSGEPTSQSDEERQTSAESSEKTTEESHDASSQSFTSEAIHSSEESSSSQISESSEQTSASYPSDSESSEESGYEEQSSFSSEESEPQSSSEESSSSQTSESSEETIASESSQESSSEEQQSSASSEESHSQSSSEGSSSQSSVEEPPVDPIAEPNEENCKNIAKLAYSSLALDLYSLGYDLHDGTLFDGDIADLGLFYTDYSLVGSSPEGSPSSDSLLFGAGYISSTPVFVPDLSLAESSFAAPSGQLILASTDSIALARFRYLYDEESIPASHFILDGFYVQYKVIGASLYIAIKSDIKRNYDLSLGTLFDYDEHDYRYIPPSELRKERRTFVSITQPLSYETIQSDLEAHLLSQEQNGYQLEKYTIIFMEKSTMDKLNGTLEDKSSFNGFDFDELSDLAIDTEKQYVHFTGDGSLEVKDIPVQTLASSGKSIWNWVADALAVATMTTVAVVIGVYGAPFGGSMISAAILGGVGDYFTQAFIKGRSWDEINWASVAISGATGALLAGIPVASTIGGTVAGTLASGAVMATERAVIDITEGETDPKTILTDAAIGALFGMAMYGVKVLASSFNGEAASSKSFGSDSSSASFHEVSNSDEQAVLEMVKSNYSSSSYSQIALDSMEDVSSISGGVSNVVSNGQHYQVAEKMADMFEEAEWLGRW